MNDIFSLLTPEQRKAAEHKDGPLLLLAGAGAGKTLTLTARIVFLLSQGISPDHILALTFTNKAAREMKTRVETYAQTVPLCLGTFHSQFHRILRREIHRLDRSSSFTLYDTQDQESILKNIIKEGFSSLKPQQSRVFLSQISQLKNARISPETASLTVDPPLSSLYTLYQQELLKANALDFDDLLLLPSIIFDYFPEVKQRYSSHFRYIMVDEYQDTNHLQYTLLQQLTTEHENLCVIGDPDQSIYGFRGARMQHILEFPQAFPKAKVIHLSTNFRSSPDIVGASNQLISHNIHRFDKTMHSSLPMGEKMKKWYVHTTEDEARSVAQSVEQRIQQGSMYRDCAVLYRTNAQSRSIEEYFLAYHIPYRVIGGLRFYARKEVKDVIAFLSFLHNPQNVLAFQRLLSLCAKGVGATSIRKILAFSQMKNVDMGTVLQHAHAIEGMRSTTKKELIRLGEVIASLQEQKTQYSFSFFMKRVIESFQYIAFLESNKEYDRIENIEELLRLSVRYDLLGEEGLATFLEEVSLVQDSDDITQENVVSLMTVHAAKGLEFEHVYITGLQEGVFPHSRSLENEHDIEEERRLMYVAMTRARHSLTLSSSSIQFQYGQRMFMAPSRFIEEIDEVYFESFPSYEYTKESEKSPLISFKVGDVVEHAFFGMAKVVKIQENKIVLLFEDRSQKVFDALLTPLKKIDFL